MILRRRRQQPPQPWLLVQAGQLRESYRPRSKDWHNVARLLAEIENATAKTQVRLDQLTHNPNARASTRARLVRELDQLEDATNLVWELQAHVTGWADHCAEPGCGEPIGTDEADVWLNPSGRCFRCLEEPTAPTPEDPFATPEQAIVLDFTEKVAEREKELERVLPPVVEVHLPRTVIDSEGRYITVHTTRPFRGSPTHRPRPQPVGGNADSPAYLEALLTPERFAKGGNIEHIARSARAYAEEKRLRGDNLANFNFAVSRLILALRGVVVTGRDQVPTH